MSMPEPSAVDDQSAIAIEVLSRLDGVTVGSGRRGFGSAALCVDGRIFAIPRPGGLVLKLPSPRVAQLLACGDGTSFDAGKGRPMKEWVVIGFNLDDRWLTLAKEALAFVAAGSPKRPAAGTPAGNASGS